MTKTDRYEMLLNRRLAELTDDMKRIERRLGERPDPDPEERSVEREDDEMLDSLGASARSEARRIWAALDRIAQGGFGLCITCGDAISDARLTIVPDATQCCRCMGVARSATPLTRSL